MKVLFTNILALLFLSASLQAQTAKDIFTAENLVWYGLDYSHARLVGVKDEKPDVIQSKMLAEWNNTTYFDRENFAHESIFRKILVRVDNKVVPARNQATSTATLFGGGTPSISKQTIDKIISEYKGGNRTEGIGVVYIVEYMDKGKKEAVAHVTFFDIATQKVLLTKRLIGKAGHPGLTMYWAMAFSRIGKDIADKYWDVWKAESK